MAKTILDYCDPNMRMMLAKGSVLMQEGARSGHIYVLSEGIVEVWRGQTLVATIDQPGAVFGEMSVLLDLPHTATVRAKTNCVAYGYGDAEQFLGSHPMITLAIARLLAQRVHQATTHLVDLNANMLGMVNVWAW
jgi:CRP/FNR family transcriptional regulator, cyclic AMP receptor protein